MLGFGTKKIKKLTNKLENQQASIANLTNALTWGQYELFDGEKTSGELGRVKNIYPDYYSARERAWELQLTNDVVKLVMNKLSTWVVGKGLRFNAIPSKELKLDRDSFIKNVEYRFRTYLLSKYSDHSTEVNFHTKAKESFLNSKVSGDVFCILRVEDKRVTVQLVDGASIATPLNYTGKNQIFEGVEYNEKGQHVAYHIYNDDLDFQRIPAIHEPTGLKMAFLVYNSKFRLNETRGLPMLIEDFEKIKNLERYIDATVKNAEVSSELILVNEHDNSSTGEDVFKNPVLKKLSSTSVERDDLPTPGCFKNNLVKLTNGVALNNTIGGKIKMIKPNAESLMPDFLEANLKLIFASAGIPYEVALSVYNSNYSASRAAIKDWEQTLKVMVNDFSMQFYKPFYDLWLYNEVLLGNVDAFELVKAYNKKDYITIESINKASFTGVSVPSIDPFKEINAVRKATGDEFTPYMTGEQAAEIISQQDYSEIQEQVKAERQIAVKPEKKDEEI